MLIVWGPQWPAGLRWGDCRALGRCPLAGFAGLLTLIKGCVLIYANGGATVAGSHRHPSPRFPAGAIRQQALQIKHFLFKAIT